MARIACYGRRAPPLPAAVKLRPRRPAEAAGVSVREEAGLLLTSVSQSVVRRRNVATATYH